MPTIRTTEGDLVEVLNFWRNKLLCWHRRKHWRVLPDRNGGEMYCSKCYLKVASIHEWKAKNVY